jgi:hypothetical protein
MRVCWGRGKAELEFFQGEGLHLIIQNLHLSGSRYQGQIYGDDLGQLGSEDLYDLRLGHDNDFDSVHDTFFAVYPAGFRGPLRRQAGLTDLQRQTVTPGALFLGHLFGDDDVSALKELVEGVGEYRDILRLFPAELAIIGLAAAKVLVARYWCIQGRPHS